MSINTTELLQLAQEVVASHQRHFPAETTWESKQYPGAYDVLVDTRQEEWGVAWQVAVYGRVAGHIEEMCVCWCLDGNAPQLRTHEALEAEYPTVTATLRAVKEGA